MYEASHVPPRAWVPRQGQGQGDKRAKVSASNRTPDVEGRRYENDHISYHIYVVHAHIFER